MKKKSMGINAVLNALRTALGAIFPLITFPYVSRILGVENIGRYNFSYSVVNYTALFAALGVHTYAVRECATVREDRQKLNTMASEIFSINLAATVIAYAALFALCVIVPKFAENRALIYVFSLEIIFTTIGCEWVYPVFEDYLYITLRTLGVYIISMILLFALVHTERDLIKYTIVSAVSVCGANVANLIGRGKYCTICPTFKPNLKQHLLPIMTIFMNTVTTTVYVNSDVLILGLMTSDTYVGLYSVSVRIYTIIKRILAAVITVSLPRLSNCWSNGEGDKLEEICRNIFNTLLILVAPAMVGLFAMSKQIVLLVSGSAFEQSQASLAMLSIALLFSLFNWFFTFCILIPSGNEKKVLQGTVVAALVNIVFNIILISHFQERAAAFTTCMAEAVALGFSYVRSRRILKMQVKWGDIASIIAGCAVIVVVCLMTDCFVGKRTVVSLAIAIPASVAAYAVVLIAGKNRYVGEMLHSINRRLKKID